MPYYCPSCHTKVVKIIHDSICCDYCDKWFHFECTELRRTQFDIFCKDESLSWSCTKCSVDRCKKCEIITRHGGKIICDLCHNPYHLKCAGLGKNSLLPGIGKDCIWYCYACNENIFLFNNLTTKSNKPQE